jgi:hypothetical protein
MLPAESFFRERMSASPEKRKQPDDGVNNIFFFVSSSLSASVSALPAMKSHEKFLIPPFAECMMSGMIIYP